MNEIIKNISAEFIREALASPRMMEDLAAMEKYMSESYSGRTFIELLQNADDAGAKRVEIFSVGNDLVVANDGRPFDKNDILAICRSGASSKQRGDSIGYRGVGFKSTTAISTEIVIHSADAYFTFSKAVCARELNVSPEKVPTIRIPFAYDKSSLKVSLHEAIELRKKQKYTTFFIFLDAKINTFLNELDGFNGGWLLFLRNVGSVSISCGRRQDICQVTRKKISSTDSIVEISGAGDEWYMVSQEDVSLAFKYTTDDGIIPCDIEEAVFCCFLPTMDKTGFPFRVNADFSTDPSRKHIIMDESTDQALKGIQKLYAAFIQRIMHDRNEELYAAVSLLNVRISLNSLIIKFQNGINDELRLCLWVLLNSGKFVSPKTAIIYPSWMDADEKVELSTKVPKALSECVSYKLEDKIQKLDELLMKLGSMEFSANGLMGILTDVDSVKVLSTSLIGKIFVFSNRANSFNEDFVKKQFIPVRAGILRIDTLSDMVSLDPEFKETISSLLNNKEKEKLSKKYLVFKGLDAKKKSSIRGNLKKTHASEEKMAKTNALAVNKWKTPIQNCTAIETLAGNSVKDVSGKNEEYDIISTEKDGKSRYISVKTVGSLGDSFVLSEKEYAAAQRLSDDYIIYIFTNSTSEIEYAVLSNPIDSSHMEKVVKEWEWICDSYSAENQNTESSTEIMDETFLKSIDASFFNAAQKEVLREYLEKGSDTDLSNRNVIVEQINFITDFHTGENLFVQNGEKITISSAKAAALRQILKC